MKNFTSPNQKVGLLGETVACSYLRNLGFLIIERNYTKKWGEIDIVAKYAGCVHFIEVKSVSCEIFPEFSRETEGYRPEDQVHFFKQRRLARTIQTYVDDNKVEEWEFDVICVFLNHHVKMARVKFLKNLILN